MMEAVSASETSVYSMDTRRRYIPENSNLHTRLRENLKSHSQVNIGKWNETVSRFGLIRELKFSDYRSSLSIRHNFQINLLLAL
jgi:hypothetical protein